MYGGQRLRGWLVLSALGSLPVLSYRPIAPIRGRSLQPSDHAPRQTRILSTTAGDDRSGGDESPQRAQESSWSILGAGEFGAGEQKQSEAWREGSFGGSRGAFDPMVVSNGRQDLAKRGEEVELEEGGRGWSSLPPGRLRGCVKALSEALGLSAARAEAVAIAILQSDDSGVSVGSSMERGDEERRARGSEGAPMKGFVDDEGKWAATVVRTQEERNMGSPTEDEALEREEEQRMLDVVTTFFGAGFLAKDLDELLGSTPELGRAGAAKRAAAVSQQLAERLGLRKYDVRRIARSSPGVLTRDPRDIVAFAEAMERYGVRGKGLVLAIIRCPSLLAVGEQDVERVVHGLSAPPLAVDIQRIGTLLRQAPWIVGVDVDRQLVPVGAFLRSVGCTDLGNILRTFPGVVELCIDSELAPRLDFLRFGVGLDDKDDIPSVVHAFPLILGLDVESRMAPVVAALRDLDISPSDIARIIRAFPSILGLDPQEHFSRSVGFLRAIGVKNVARFVRRLPPVLGYDVTTNLKPKYDFLCEELKLSVYDVSRFPAYFSYPLDRVIMPRMRFLEKLNKRAMYYELNKILTPGDAAFAEKVAGASAESYAVFKDALLNQIRRAQQLEGQTDIEEKRKAKRSKTANQTSLRSPSPQEATADDAGRSAAAREAERNEREKSSRLQPERRRGEGDGDPKASREGAAVCQNDARSDGNSDRQGAGEESEVTWPAPGALWIDLREPIAAFEEPLGRPALRGPVLRMRGEEAETERERRRTKTRRRRTEWNGQAEEEPQQPAVRFEGEGEVSGLPNEEAADGADDEDRSDDGSFPGGNGAVRAEAWAAELLQLVKSSVSDRQVPIVLVGAQTAPIARTVLQRDGYAKVFIFGRADPLPSPLPSSSSLASQGISQGSSTDGLQAGKGVATVSSARSMRRFSSVALARSLLLSPTDFYLATL